VHWPVLTPPDDPAGLEGAVAADAAAHVHAYKGLERLVKNGKVGAGVSLSEVSVRFAHSC
jgi:hypothetical protein